MGESVMAEWKPCSQADAFKNGSDAKAQAREDKDATRTIDARSVDDGEKCWRNHMECDDDKVGNLSRKKLKNPAYQV